jgi:hypothetical protein
MNSSFMKMDVFVHPQFRAQFGNFVDAVESQINLAPALSCSPWKGMSISAQWIFPIQNELGMEGDHGRPGLLTINQTLRLPFNSFASGTVGYFTQHRYGADLEIKKYWKNGRFAAGANVGYTGFAEYLENVWYYSNVDRWTYFLGGEFRFASLDVVVKASYGKFIYQDTGIRFDVVRQFGEVAVGFFGVKTRDGKNGGFSFNVPLFPSKRLNPKRIRISPALSFPFAYRYKGLPLYGLQYSTANSVDEFMENLNPDFMRNHLRKN